MKRMTMTVTAQDRVSQGKRDVASDIYKSVQKKLFDQNLSVSMNFSNLSDFHVEVHELACC